MKFLFVLPFTNCRRSAVVALTVLCSGFAAFSQSSDLRFPTPVRTNEIVGTIKARDVGDARLTTYYYTFEGEQGDLFVNVQSRNFTGDIDVYVMSGQRPLTKIVTYADVAETETGRVIYLRKPERLLLRVEGRSPGDDDATIRIKFAGSFAASKLEDGTEPSLPKSSAEIDTGIRVNSVGTILGVIPKTKPTPEAVVEKSTEAQSDRKLEEEKSREAAAASSETKEPEAETAAKKNEVVVSDPLAEKASEPGTKAPSTSRRNRRNRNSTTASATPSEPKTDPVQPENTEADPKTSSSTNRRSRRTSSATEKKEPAPDPMAGINLVIEFKDGSTVERPMNEVLRFAVERAVLTVISKNGSIGRYQMTQVASVTIR